MTRPTTAAAPLGDATPFAMAAWFTGFVLALEFALSRLVY